MTIKDDLQHALASHLNTLKIIDRRCDGLIAENERLRNVIASISKRKNINWQVLIIAEQALNERKKMNKELIEKLKKNEKPFSLLSTEEQKYMDEVGVENIEYYNGDMWIKKPDRVPELWKHSTYRIRPDYQAEPEYEDYEIKVYKFAVHGTPVDLLGIEIDRDEWPLDCIPSMPNFDGFYKVDGFGDKEELVLDLIATVYRKKANTTKIYARFVK